MIWYCNFRNFVGFYFRMCEVLGKLNLKNDKITLSFIDVGKLGPHREFLTWQICLLPLFLKIKFSQKFPNLQYYCH